MPEARIKTTFGQIVVSYSNTEELSKLLEDVPAAVALVQSKTLGINPGEPKKPKPGCEEVYRFDPSGQLELLRKPTKSVALVALALYAMDPEPMAPTAIEHLTGLSDVASSVLSQTANKRYFARRPENKYGLTTFGFQWARSKVIASLKS